MTNSEHYELEKLFQEMRHDAAADLEADDDAKADAAMSLRRATLNRWSMIVLFLAGLAFAALPLAMAVMEGR